MSFLPPIAILCFVILIIIIALKIENHFSYLKILHPEKFNNVSSFVDSRTKMRPIRAGFGMKIFLPLFKDRNIQAEKDNWKLKRLGYKIQINCYLIWVLLVIIVTLFSIIIPHYKN